MEQRIQFRFSYLLGVILALFAFSSVANAQASDSSIRVLQEAVEASKIELIADDQNNVVGIRAKECEVCTVTSFLPSPELTFNLGNEEITGKEALRLNGVSGTVFYNAETHLAEKINYFSR